MDPSRRRTDSAAWPRRGFPWFPPYGRDNNALGAGEGSLDSYRMEGRGPERGRIRGGACSWSPAGRGQSAVPARPLMALWFPTLLLGSKTRDMESGRSSLLQDEVPDGDQLEARGSEPAASEAPGTPESSRLFRRCGDPPWGGLTLTLGTRPSWDLALGRVLKISCKFFYLFKNESLGKQKNHVVSTAPEKNDPNG